MRILADGIRVWGRIDTNTFPPYQRILESAGDVLSSVTVDAAELHTGVKEVASFLDTDNKAVILSAEAGDQSLAIDGWTDYGTDETVSTEVPVTQLRSNLKVAVRSAYMLDILKQTDSGKPVGTVTIDVYPVNMVIVRFVVSDDIHLLMGLQN